MAHKTNRARKPADTFTSTGGSTTIAPSKGNSINGPRMVPRTSKAFQRFLRRIKDPERRYNALMQRRDASAATEEEHRRYHSRLRDHALQLQSDHRSGRGGSTFRINGGYEGFGYGNASSILPGYGLSGSLSGSVRGTSSFY